MLKELCRVRFAPSPTGNLHLGSLRTALFNFLIARKRGGVFALRIEDTDRKRLVPGCAEQFEETLGNYGLKLDESPRLGGLFGPYVQSKRLHFYRFYTEMLIESGHAYPCFCTAQRLDLLRRNAMREKSNARYDGRCRTLTREDVSARLADAQPHVIRFKFDAGNVYFHDTVFGDNLHHVDEGDFIILKSDGYPTYHFANVVDDHAMQFTHVVRGAEWLPSTPKHVRLYEKFGWRQPTWVHLPLLTRDGLHKLSKRDADAFVRYYDQDEGYLPLAVLNFLLRNGSGLRNFDSTHLYTIDEMIENFDETLITRNNFMMDQASLKNYGRLAFRGADFESRIFPDIIRRLERHSLENNFEINEELLKPAYIKKVVDFLLQNEESFDKMSMLTNGQFRFFFYWSGLEVTSKILSKMSAKFASRWLRKTLKQEFPDGWRPDNLRRLATSTENSEQNFGARNESLNRMLNECQDEKIDKEMEEDGQISYRKLTMLLRIAITGEVSGPPITELVDFFSETECINRVQATLTLLSNEISGKILADSREETRNEATV